MKDPYDIRSLALTMGNALDAAIAEQPGITALEVCGALGAVAGVVVAYALPSASAEADEVHLDVMAQAYRSTLLEVLVAARGAREAGRAGVQ